MSGSYRCLCGGSSRCSFRRRHRGGASGACPPIVPAPNVVVHTLVLSNALGTTVIVRHVVTSVKHGIVAGIATVATVRRGCGGRCGSAGASTAVAVVAVLQRIAVVVWVLNHPMVARVAVASSCVHASAAVCSPAKAGQCHNYHTKGRHCQTKLLRRVRGGHCSDSDSRFRVVVVVPCSVHCAIGQTHRRADRQCSGQSSLLCSSP